MSQFPWKGLVEGYTEALNYMKNRMHGKVTSLRTPWQKFDDAGIDGIEWNNTVVLGGRPGSGKTMVKDQIVRELHKRNPNQEIRVLEFQFEMVSRASAIREYSAVLGRSYKYLCSSSGLKLTDEDLMKCLEYSKKKKLSPIDIIDQPCTVSQFKEYVKKYMETFHYMESIPEKEGKPAHTIKKYKNTVITIDHSILFKKDAHEGTKTDTVVNLAEACTELKRKYPIIFIVLSQLNREVEQLTRQEDGKYGNYILTSDFFAGDGLLQHADIQVGINRPGEKKIRFYGPERFIIPDDRLLVFHFLKVRNGDPRMSFFRAEYEKMSIVECDAPPRQELKTRSKE